MRYFSNNYRAFLGVLEDIFVVKELKMVLNFKPGEKKVENEVITMSRAWYKEKIRVQDRIRTYDLPNTGRAKHDTRFIFDNFGCYSFSALPTLPGDTFFRLFDFSVLEKDSTSVK